MNRNEFEDFIKRSPQYTRLIFCYGPQLFIRDGDEYRNLAIQIAWEVWQQTIRIVGTGSGYQPKSGRSINGQKLSPPRKP